MIEQPAVRINSTVRQTPCADMSTVAPILGHRSDRHYTTIKKIGRHDPESGRGFPLAPPPGPVTAGANIYEQENVDRRGPPGRNPGRRRRWK